MKRIISIFIAASILITFSSCKAVLHLKMKDTVDKDVKLLERDDKTVIFIPMNHIGKESYFESVKRIVESARSENYNVFFESVYYQAGTSESKKDTLDRKIRKLIGYHITSSYKDDENKSYPNYLKENNYVMQTAENTGLKQGDILADLSINELIRLYEEDYGLIPLTECDFKTDLLEKYTCKKNRNLAPYAFLKTYRERNLIDRIIQSDNSKILVIYGAGHWYGVSRKLTNLGFKISKLNEKT